MRRHSGILVGDTRPGGTVDWDGKKQATSTSQTQTDDGAQERTSTSPLRPVPVTGLAIGGPTGAPVERTAAEIVEAAGKVTTKVGLIGSATRARSDEAGLLWTGLTTPPTGTVKGYWISSDGNRRYRPPSYKPTLKLTQSNFESGPPPSRPHKDNWDTNAHLTITD